MNQHQRVAQLLDEIAGALREQGDWASVPPDPTRLASDQPFCVDTLAFSEWLQFILLPRLWALLEGQLALPVVSGIAPMAELYFAGRVDAEKLISLLAALDRALVEE